MLKEYDDNVFEQAGIRKTKYSKSCRTKEEAYQCVQKINLTVL